MSIRAEGFAALSFVRMAVSLCHTDASGLGKTYTRMRITDSDYSSQWGSMRIRFRANAASADPPPPHTHSPHTLPPLDLMECCECFLVLLAGTPYMWDGFDENSPTRHLTAVSCSLLLCYWGQLGSSFYFSFIHLVCM